jgi:LysM repeat protein
MFLQISGCGPSASEKEIENMTYRLKRLETRVAALELGNDTLNDLDKKVKRIMEENERRQTALILQISKLERQIQSSPPAAGITPPAVKKTETVVSPLPVATVKAEKKPEAPAAVTTSPAARYHVVQKGDTLYSISRQYDLKPDELKKMNNLDSNVINPGQELRVR